MMYIILGVIMILFAWMQAAYAKLKLYKGEARAAWVRIDSLLQTRAAYILRLLEISSEKSFAGQDLLAEIFDLDGGYAQVEDREIISERAEAVTPLLDRFFGEAEANESLSNHDEFQELKANLEDLEEEIANQSIPYNKSIVLYNNHREKPSLRLQIAILGAIPLKEFHIRSYSLAGSIED